MSKYLLYAVGEIALGINPEALLADKYFENIIAEALISYNYVNRSGLKLIKHIDSLQEFIETTYQ